MKKFISKINYYRFRSNLWQDTFMRCLLMGVFITLFYTVQAQWVLPLQTNNPDPLDALNTSMRTVVSSILYVVLIIVVAIAIIMMGIYIMGYSIQKRIIVVVFIMVLL